MAKFEVVSKYAAQGIQLPKRATTQAAGYDFEVAEDIIIPSYHDLMSAAIMCELKAGTYSLDTIAAFTKKYQIKPTLVPTGIKCKLDPNTYLQLSVRSSCPLKYWLILANGVGIIDAKEVIYYDTYVPYLWKEF